MSVKLHKVTIFVVDAGHDDNPLDELYGDCCHNGFAKIVEVQTVEFDRKWDDDDPLNNTIVMNSRSTLEALVSGGSIHKEIKD